MDDADRRLLNVLQSEFPLVSKPFAAIGKRLELSEAEVMERVGRLKADKVIRQIGAIFDSRALGYRSTLAAFHVPEDRIQAVAAAINLQSGVSHNYARNHAYNLWFTLTVPPEGDPEADVKRLASENGISRFLYLPTLRVFKVAVQFDMVGMESRSQAQAEDAGSEPPLEAGAIDPSLVRELQKDLELVSQPFSAQAQSIGLSEDELLERASVLQRRGVIRRFAAVLHHRKAGFAANGMGIWIVPQERVEEVGKAIASFPQVTHCYERPTYPDWPYNLFSMIHSQTSEGCRQVAQEISYETGITDFDLLFSTKEYKKSRVKYFE